MENLIFGTITLLVCIYCYWLSWVKFNTRDFRGAIILIVLGGLFLRFYTASDWYLHPWDEKFHALVAKNLMQHPFKPTLYEYSFLPYDFKNWGANHIWLHKQPMALWSMALSLKLFGLNELALRLPSILLSTFAIWLTYKITLFFFDRKTALLAAFLHSIHGLILELTGGRITTDHIDLFFMFFIELAVYFSIVSMQKNRKWPLVFIGLSIGLAILSKWLPALIVIPIWFCLCLKKGNSLQKIFIELLIILSICVITFLPWQLYIHSSFPIEANWESKYNIRHLFEGLETHDQPFYYHFNTIRILFGELIYIPLFWLIYILIKRRKKKSSFHLLAILTWIIIPLLFFSFAKTKMQAYTMFCAPAFFILTAYFWRFLYFKQKQRLKPHFFISILMVLLIALPLRYSIERIKPFSLREREPHWKKEIIAFDETLKAVDKNIVFNEGRPIEMMFYSQVLAAYEYTPDDASLIKLLEEGYVLYIKNDEGNYSLYQKPK